jgi:putative GTP pyrophosphokinase
MVKSLYNAIENELYMNKTDKDKSIKEAVSWYTQHKELYRKLAQKIEGIIIEILVEENIPIHSIANRVKEVSSFAKKIEKPQYTNPKDEITDLAGIRIIAYVESDLVRICEVIKKNFKIDSDKSIDKSKALGNDKVGYKSIHFIGELKSERLKLPDLKIWFLKFRCGQFCSMHGLK